MSPFSTECTLFEQYKEYDGSQAGADLHITDETGAITRFYVDPFAGIPTNPDGSPLHVRPKRDAAAIDGCKQSLSYPIFGNPIWCFPDRRSAVPMNININKLAMNDTKADRRCVTCPDCMNCEYDDYRGIPYMREGYTFV